MNAFAADLLVGFFSFIHSAWGLVSRPYATYRAIVKRSDSTEGIFIGLFLMMYFALASLVKTAAFRPFLLTKHFVVLTGATLGTYIFMVAILYSLSRLLRGEGRLKSIAIAWGYTLLPTLIWFLITSVMYLVLPPPRTLRLQGVLYSLLYLVFSCALFFWKVTLGYLTLRFSMRLDLWRIVVVAFVVIPLVGLYSVLMYKLGIFRIPFI